MNRIKIVGSVSILALSLALPLVSLAVVNDNENSGIGTSVIQCPDPALTMTLHRGQRDATTGGQVSALQSFLADFFNLPDNFPTGYFGGQTQAYVKQFQAQKGIDQVGFVGRLTRAAILAACDGTSPTPPTVSITVTAPNGGESWEEGIINTVTWTPYGYNPDINPSKDVTAYLENSNGYGGYTTLGKVEESGKASIHWLTGALNSETQGSNFVQPGQYYIRVVNNVTGASDRSDSYFKILPKPIDLKLNGSDGPIPAQYGVPVSASWTSSGTTHCRLDNAYADPAGSVYPVPNFDNMPTSGTRTIYVPAQQNWYVNLYCWRLDGGSINDTVVSNANSASSSIRVLSPNGGEILDPTQPMLIRFMPQGLSAVAIALYKNDMWKTWINKYFIPTGKDVDGFSWTPANDLTTFAAPDNQGAIFKIYVTGKPSNGIGYVEDKSDGPFSFIGSTSSAPSCTLTAAHGTIVLGTTETLSWTSQNATNISLAIAGEKGTVPTIIGGLPLSGSQVVNPNWVGTAPYTLTVSGAGGTATCTANLSVESASINGNPITTSSLTPTISGIANTIDGKVGIVLGDGGKVYGSGMITENGNTWSVTISPALSVGTYTIYVYDSNNLLLKTGTLTVTGTQTSASLIATPSSGVAPLTVNFSGTVPDSYYSITFGDGQSSGLGCSGGCGGTSLNVVQTHTYAFPGTFTATVTGGVGGTGHTASATVTVGIAPLININLGSAVVGLWNGFSGFFAPH